MSDTVRVLRIYEFTGKREHVEEQLKNSLQSEFCNGKITIRCATLGTFPEILKQTDQKEGQQQ